MKKLIFGVALLALVSSASAMNDWKTSAGGVGRNWFLASNWSMELVPDLTYANGDVRLHDTYGLPAAQTPRINAGENALAYQIRVGGSGAAQVPYNIGMLTMDGGTLTTVNYIMTGTDSSSIRSGALYMNGGTINVGTPPSTGGHLYIGHGRSDMAAGISGWLYMTGGTINVLNNFSIARYNASGYAYISGGTIYANDFFMKAENSTGTAHMDVTGSGKVVLNGDRTAAVAGYISSGWLTGNGNDLDIQYDYDISNPGKTTVWAVSSAKATSPSPVNGATNVAKTTTLSWTAGPGAVSHDVYFGTDETKVTDANRANKLGVLVRQDHDANTYDPYGLLKLNTTYYWRIDEVNDPNIWKGDVWSFSTLPYFVVEASGTVTPWMRLDSNSTIFGLPNATIPDPIQVRVTNQAGTVTPDLVGIPVNFQIIEAPIGASGQKLIPGDDTSVTIPTDANGYAQVNLVLGDQNGVYRVAITESDSNYTIDWVRALTPGVTADLEFQTVPTTPCLANGIDVIPVTISALDFQGNPVSGAQIFVGSRIGRDVKQTFSTIDKGAGIYEALTTSTVSGEAQLAAWDALTNVQCQSTAPIQFIPGEANRVAIYAAIPKSSEPFDEATLYAFVVDAFENKIGSASANVEFTTDLGTITSETVIADEFVAVLHSSSPGIATVTATDIISGLVSELRQISFPYLLPVDIHKKPFKNHHIKFWKPKGADVRALIAGEISGKRIVYGIKSPKLCGPKIYITYTVNEYDFDKVDIPDAKGKKDGILDEFKNDGFTNSANPTAEEKNLVKNTQAGAENVYIVPGMSDNSFGECILNKGVVLNLRTGLTKPPDGLTLAHENTHYWGLNEPNHYENNEPLGPENIGNVNGVASLDCSNNGILSQGQLAKLRAKFHCPGPNPVYAGSIGNQINLRFTNNGQPGNPFATLTSLTVTGIQSTPTFVLNFSPTTTTLTPSTLLPGETGTATFFFDVAPNIEVGIGSFIELMVTSDSGDVFYPLLYLDITGNYLVVDDFESYTATDPNIIYKTWKDGTSYPGYGGNGTGSIIGLADPPYVEQYITYVSWQSIPYSYDNTSDYGAGYYSEAEADTSELQIGSNWNRDGVRALTLYFYGDPNNDANVTERMYMALEDNDSVAVVYYDGNSNDVRESKWHEWNIRLTDFTNVDLNNVNKVYIGFGDRDNNSTPGGSGLVFFDELRLYPPRCVLSKRGTVGGVANVANFDSFSEGDNGLTITDGGITFKNLDRYWDQGYPGSFCIEASTSEQMGPFFSPPNYLNAGGYVPGPGAGFGRFGSADIVFNGLASSAQVDIFYLPAGPSSNRLALEAIQGGNVVATAEMGFVVASGIQRELLAITGVSFDSLRLRAYGPDSNGAVGIGIDNVEIVSVPGNEPIADLTDDCVVDVADLEILCQEWLTAGIKADIYPNGIVDFRDFAVLANEWMTEKLWP